MQSHQAHPSRGFRGNDSRRGGTFSPRSHGPNASAVPSRAQVTSGLSVSIVLKADQSTGREVQGVVQDVLTSGDHPRGIKVRLTDGRIGRVQRMVTNSDEARSGEMHIVSNAAAQADASRPMRRQQLRSRDIRLDDDVEAPPAEMDLAAYIKPAKPRKRGAKRIEEQQQEAEVKLVSCPVCGNFEGDEGAVNHHVASHFD